MPFTVACAQIAPAKAEVERNLDTIAEAIIQASSEGAELVVFPETSTTGYFLEGGVLEASLTADSLFEKLESRLKGKLQRPCDALVGFYQSDRGNLYNSAAYLEFGTPSGRLLHVYQKFFLPTYGVFDEERFVSRGHQLGVFDSRLGRFGILICEDVWHSILPALCAVAGAQAILVPSASPARGFSGTSIENLERYCRMTRAVSEEHGVFSINCQLVGFEGGKGFIGGSSVTDPTGRVLASGPVGEEHLLLAPVDLDLVTVARASLPLISDLQSAWQDIKRVVASLDA
jgi:predicted amidohydrolase